jgi:hypothetical protein
MIAQTQVLSRSDFCLPLLFCYAGKDVISNVTTNQQYAIAIYQEDKTIVCRKKNSHKVLNEIDRKDLYETISTWILQRTWGPNRDTLQLIKMWYR